MYALAYFREAPESSDDTEARGTLHGSTLTGNECASCMAVGAMPLLVAALLKVTPEGWVEKVNTKKYFDEDQEG